MNIFDSSHIEIPIYYIKISFLEISEYKISFFAIHEKQQYLHDFTVLRFPRKFCKVFL